MRFDIAACLAFAAVATASAIPHDHHEVDHLTSPVSRSPLDKRDSYDCKGSSMCSSLQVRACDDAVNNRLIRNDVVNYGASGSGRPNGGTCSPIAFGYGCGIFIQGKSHCARTGNQMWWDYQDIRKAGCQKCGTKHWGDGCMTTVNYVGGC